MAEKVDVLTSLVLFLVFLSCTLANELAKGWGDHIDWKTLDDGMYLSKEQNKPLMLVIHKSWCGACKALKPKFAESEKIKELSQHFIMVNAGDDDEPRDDQYTPDGGYIPRVLFLDPEGKVRKEYYNVDGNANYKYYYPMTEHIEKSMMKVMEEMSVPVAKNLDAVVWRLLVRLSHYFVFWFGDDCFRSRVTNLCFGLETAGEVESQLCVLVWGLAGLGRVTTLCFGLETAGEVESQRFGLETAGEVESQLCVLV
ncbi:hypothetical protein FSP39_005211 [Pinctada imbricata]|uniref:Thioredoxin domain-containing protein 12 n=1 Tax=Pinctada imbricata TaxID=66713 RepID=A0AA88XX75_PINIB|nr:hypothetical protein FSP39_005211 [Pinctada imbricata]